MSALAVATKVKGLVITSSPSPQPSARTPRWSAAVPLETATASSTPSRAAKLRSNFSTFGPSETRPELSASSTSSRSRSPRSGCASGIGSLTGGRSVRAGLEGVLERIDQRLPGRLDDVLRDADRAPFALPVGGVEQHPGDSPGAVVLVEDADLVVGQLDLGQVRVAVGDRLAQGPVQRVHRAVALGGANVALALHPDLDRGLGHHLAVLALLGDHPEALQPEQGLVGAGL